MKAYLYYWKYVGGNKLYAITTDKIMKDKFEQTRNMKRFELRTIESSNDEIELLIARFHGCRLVSSPVEIDGKVMELIMTEDEEEKIYIAQTGNILNELSKSIGTDLEEASHYFTPELMESFEFLKLYHSLRLKNDIEGRYDEFLCGCDPQNSHTHFKVNTIWLLDRLFGETFND